MRFLLFLGLFVGLKAYVYTHSYRLFDRAWMRQAVLLMAGLSVLATLVGLYGLWTRFSISGRPNPLWVNYALGLMVSFVVLELLVSGFFLLDDLWGGLRRFYTWASQEERELTGRRHWIKRAGLALGVLPFASFLHGITWGKYRFTVHRETLTFPDLPPAFDGFVIAQISDVHAGSFDQPESVRRGLELLQKQGADVLVLTGDLVNSYASEIEPYLNDFKQLEAPFGKYAVLGNHDYPIYRRMFDNEAHGQRNFEQLHEHYKTMNFQLLKNENVKLEKSGQYLRLVGVENWGRSHHFPKKGDLDVALNNCPTDDFTILLSHDPTHWEDKVRKHPKHVHLTLSGHTHGMQLGVDLPWFKWSPVKYVYKHWAGLYEEAKQYLYVNRGFGFLGFAGRVGMFPEITLLTLKKGTDEAPVG